MRQALLGTIAVVGLFLSVANSHQRALAQALREPTVDEQFRSVGNKGADGELPTLNPPQSKLTRDSRERVVQSGPAYLGVTFRSDSDGAVVRTVSPGSPAEQAGVQPNDVIESLQGIAINSSQDVLDLVAKMRPGTMLDIEVTRRVSVRAQAPLASLPATTQTVGYPPNSTAEHELLPVPANAKRYAAPTVQQPNRYTPPQVRSGSASGQPRNYNYNRNGGQSDNNRRGPVLGRRSNR